MAGKLQGGRMQERLKRLCVLLETLRASRRGLTVVAMAECTGASRATVYRDLKLLDEAGFELVNEKVNGEARRRLPADAFQKFGLSAGQVHALRLARETLAPLEGTRLLTTLDSLLRESGSRPLPVKTHGVKRATSPRVVADLERALSDRRRIEMDYRGVSDVASVRRVADPRELLVREGQLYLWAWDLDREDWRTFKISRIASVTVLDVPASPHPGFEEISDLSRSVRVWTGDPIDVCIRVAPRAASLVSEYPLVEGQVVQHRPDRSALLRATVAGLVETVRWILGWGRDATALEPPELVDAMRMELEAALAGYEAPAERGVSPIVRHGRATQRERRGATPTPEQKQKARAR